MSFRDFPFLKEISGGSLKISRRKGWFFIKVGVHLKAVFTPLKIGQMEISCLHFKQYKNPPFITQINDLGCFMNFG